MVKDGFLELIDIGKVNNLEWDSLFIMPKSLAS